jgi:hypothetical protein
MVESWVLIEGQGVDAEKLRSVSLANAKQLVVGSVPGSGTILHVAGNSAADIGNALLKFAEVPGVKAATPLMLRNK